MTEPPIGDRDGKGEGRLTVEREAECRTLVKAVPQVRDLLTELGCVRSERDVCLKRLLEAASNEEKWASEVTDLEELHAAARSGLDTALARVAEIEAERDALLEANSGLCGSVSEMARQRDEARRDRDAARVGYIAADDELSRLQPVVEAAKTLEVRIGRFFAAPNETEIQAALIDLRAAIRRLPPDALSSPPVTPPSRDAERAVVEAAEALRSYARHRLGCNVDSTDICSCGLSGVLGTLRAAVGALSSPPQGATGAHVAGMRNTFRHKDGSHCEHGGPPCGRAHVFVPAEPPQGAIDARLAEVLSGPRPEHECGDHCQEPPQGGGTEKS